MPRRGRGRHGRGLWGLVAAALLALGCLTGAEPAPPVAPPLGAPPLDNPGVGGRSSGDGPLPSGVATPATVVATAVAVEPVLAAMTLPEKVGQLMVIAFSGTAVTPDAGRMVREYGVGGVILFQQNLRDGAQTQRLTADLQARASTPLLIGIDQEGGPVVRLTRGASLFPSAMAVGATFSTDVAGGVAATTARELRDLGINTNFGPVADVNSNPHNPVIGVRSYGAHPQHVAALTAAAVHATQDSGVLAVAKHFPGHGDAGVDSHLALPRIDHPLAHLERVELPPFRAAIVAGVDGIMTAHVLLPALEPDPRRSATLSRGVLSYLRATLGFQGLIITDDLEMGAIVNDHGTAEAAKIAFQAGADLLLFRRNLAEQHRAHALLLAAVHTGEIPAERLDDSVRRILTAKARRGLLTPLRPDPPASAPTLPLDVARRGLTLVQNEGGLLPLPPAGSAPLCVVYPRQEAVHTVEIAAPGERPATLGEALQAVRPTARLAPLSFDPTPDETRAAVACARAGEVLILGTYNLDEHPALLTLMRQLAALRRPTVVVALRLPYDLTHFDTAPALLATYSHRPADLRAVAEAITGHVPPPTGHLPVPLSPRWPFGYGLLQWDAPHTAPTPPGAGAHQQ